MRFVANAVRIVLQPCGDRLGYTVSRGNAVRIVLRPPGSFAREGLGYTVSRGNAVRIVLRPPGNSAKERQNCHRLACGRRGAAFSSRGMRLRVAGPGAARAVGQRLSRFAILGAWCTGHLRRERRQLAAVVRPHMRHVDGDSVLESIEVSNQRLERKARQLSTAQLRDSRAIRSDECCDIVGVSAFQQLSEGLSQLPLERRNRIDSRRDGLVSHGATIRRAPRLIVIKRTHTCRQEREAVSSGGQPVAILPLFGRFAWGPADDTDRVPGHSCRVANETDRVPGHSCRMANDAARVPGHSCRMANDTDRLPGHSRRVANDNDRVPREMSELPTQTGEGPK
jgi:hypothetical protein